MDNSGPKPRELILLDNINRFGVEAVMGRPLGAGEIRRMRRAELIVHAFKSRASAESWPVWANENPELNIILEDAMIAGEDGR